MVKMVGHRRSRPGRLRALYFTRATAPTARGRSTTISASMPIAARRSSASSRLPPSPLERRERLEQLRALEAGMRIDVASSMTCRSASIRRRDLDGARAPR